MSCKDKPLGAAGQTKSPYFTAVYAEFSGAVLQRSETATGIPDGSSPTDKNSLEQYLARCQRAMRFFEVGIVKCLPDRFLFSQWPTDPIEGWTVTDEWQFRRNWFDWQCGKLLKEYDQGQLTWSAARQGLIRFFHSIIIGFITGQGVRT